MKNRQTVAIKTAKTKESPDGIRELDIKMLDRRPIADYYRLAGRMLNVENQVYYDTAVYGAAAITTAHVARLFTNGQADSAAQVNTATAIAEKGEFLTNMTTDGEFDNATSFLLEQIAVDVFLPAERATTYSAKNAISDPTNSALATYSAPLHYQAITRQFMLEFYRGDQKMVDGLLFQFPSAFVASGAFGSSLGGFIQNGFAVPTWNKLSEIHALQSNDRFSVRIRPLEAFTPQVPFNIRVNFIGKRISTLYA